MSNLRKYEMYDIDEYFIKFMEISPILLYTNEIDNYNMCKLKLQRKLLHKHADNSLSKEDIVLKYKELIEYANKKKELYSDVQSNFLRILKELENSDKKDEISKMSDMIESLDK